MPTTALHRNNPAASDAIDEQSFLDLTFDSRTIDQVADWLGGRTADSDYAYVVTPNVDHMIRLVDAPVAVRRAYEDADLILCDSRVLALLATWTGRELSVVPGSDLTALLFEKVLQPGDRVCLIGGNDGDDDRLQAMHPGLSIIQHRPPMGLRSDPGARANAVQKAVATRARITLFAVGSPQQELLAHEMAALAGAAGTGLCIGASTDFLLGHQRRAPHIVQRMRAEWAWRLATNPRRLAKRYLVDGPAIFPLVWRWRQKNRHQNMTTRP